jgi:hypothetical protein
VLLEAQRGDLGQVSRVLEWSISTCEESGNVVSGEWDFGTSVLCKGAHPSLVFYLLLSVDESSRTTILISGLCNVMKCAEF